MKFLIIITFIFCAVSCNNTCDITEYKKGNWISIDSSISYKLCSNDNIKLASTDSIEISFLGVLKENENILIQNEREQSFLALLTNITWGKFKQEQVIANPFLSKIFPSLPKNAECLVRLKLNKSHIPPVVQVLNIFFKAETDSLEILRLYERLSKLNFVDSIIYISSDAAIKKYSEENDSTWRSFIDKNPLPSSLSIYIKKGLYNQAVKDSLANMFSGENIISETNFPPDDPSIQTQLVEFLKFPFFIKIKS